MKLGLMAAVASLMAGPVTAATVVTADRYLDVNSGRYVENPAIFIDDGGHITSVGDARTVRWGAEVKHGFVATCNSTHFFIVRSGEVWTSSGKYCLGGITRGLALEIAREAGIPAIEKDFSLTDVYGADEAFVTGTFAGIVPVREIDGRGLTCRGPMVERLQQLYADRVERDVMEQNRP